MAMCSQWRQWTRPVIMSLYGLFVLIVVPLLIVNSVKDGFKTKDQLILIGGLFVLTAIPISVWHITQHVNHFTKPILQKHIIRILWMVPIYALNAWLGLIFPKHSIYMDSIRECYEAYVIYNFMVYLLNYLNLEMDLEATLEDKPPVNHIFPLCCLTPWKMGREFVHNCKQCILQYAVVRPFTTFVSVICEINGVYGESTFSPNVAYPYILAVNNVSQFTAMYCLVLFYRANRAELKDMKPVPKFLCIKAVIFFSFFQGVIINFLVYFEYIKDVFGEDDDYRILSSKLQDFLICIEMFFAAIAHKYSFPHYPFHLNTPHNNPGGSWFNAFIAMLDISDVQQDVTEHFGVVGSSLSRRLRGRTAYQMARGTTTEADHLIPASNSTASCYQSGLQTGSINALSSADLTKSNYGSTDAVAGGYHQHDGINIIKNATAKEYSPNYGVPKTSNYFYPNSSSNSSAKNDKSTSDNTTNTSKSETYTGLPGSDGKNMKKSDSNASDWLSTPTDEMIGIDVKGLENDRINFKPDPRV